LLSGAVWQPGKALENDFLCGRVVDMNFHHAKIDFEF